MLAATAGITARSQLESSTLRIMQHEWQWNLSISKIALHNFVLIRDLIPGIIDSGPMCITDLFQN